MRHVGVESTRALKLPVGRRTVNIGKVSCTVGSLSLDRNMRHSSAVLPQAYITAMRYPITARALCFSLGLRRSNEHTAWSHSPPAELHQPRAANAVSVKTETGSSRISLWDDARTRRGGPSQPTTPALIPLHLPARRPHAQQWRARGQREGLAHRSHVFVPPLQI